MKRFLIPCLLLAATAAVAAPPPKAKSSLVERVGDTAIIKVPSDSFASLTPREKRLAYWLSQASIAVDPIIYDQLSRFGLREKYILDLIAAHPDAVAPASRKKIDSYTKLFWVNHGNHNDVTALKFVPSFTFEELEAAALSAMHHAKSVKLTDADLKDELEKLRPTMFDPAFEPQLTAKNPVGGLDILQASANNFYARDVKLADLEGFKEQHPLNSRVVKDGNGRLVEEVYRAGTPDGTVPPGLYARYLGKAIEFLTKAKADAEPGQAEVLDALIRYYQTGDYADWIRFDTLWVRNNPRVDFANGFIEVYRDPRGAKGTSQSFVSVIDAKQDALMRKIAANAQYFEERAPWLDQYKKQGVKPPLAKAIETVIETGDFGVTTIGDNLPNENEVREKDGTKSFLFTGSTRALAHVAPASKEFAYDDNVAKLAEKYGDEAEDLNTALHEIIGHGSGKVSPKLTKPPETYLREYYSTLEEARADLMALWNIWDPKLKELGVITSQENVAKAMYYRAANAPLTQLGSIPKGDTIEEDHQRDRQLIVHYIIDKVPGAIEYVKKNGKTYVRIDDFQKMRKGVGLLLAELMRIKAEGDYEAIKGLIDQYGVHFDPKLRDEVVARFNKLNRPRYFDGFHPRLTLSGNSVTIGYPESFTRERLGWASMYEEVR